MDDSSTTQALIQQAVHAGISAHLAAHAFVTVASGGAPPAIKLFAHAADAESGCVFLLEAVVDTAARTASVTVKSDADAARAGQLEAVVAAALRGFGT